MKNFCRVVTSCKSTPCASFAPRSHTHSHTQILSSSTTFRQTRKHSRGTVCFARITPYEEAHTAPARATWIQSHSPNVQATPAVDSSFPIQHQIFREWCLGGPLRYRFLLGPAVNVAHQCLCWKFQQRRQDPSQQKDEEVRRDQSKK